MNCMRCGREIPSEQVFCDDCLLEMEKCPVDSSTPVYIPKRAENSGKKSVKRKTVSLEDQIAALRRMNRRLAIAVTVLALLVLAMIYPAVKYLMEDHFKLGQNYTSITSVVSTGTDQAGN